MQRAPRRRFTDEFKAQATFLGESIGPAKAARQLDISVKTLVNWLHAARAGKPLSSPGLSCSFYSVPYKLIGAHVDVRLRVNAGVSPARRGK